MLFNSFIRLYKAWSLTVHIIHCNLYCISYFVREIILFIQFFHKTGVGFDSCLYTYYQKFCSWGLLSILTTTCTEVTLENKNHREIECLRQRERNRELVKAYAVLFFVFIESYLNKQFQLNNINNLLVLTSNCQVYAHIMNFNRL